MNHPELVLAVAMGEVKLPLRLCDRNDLLPELLLLWKLWWSCVSIEERGRPILRPFDFEDEEGRFDCPKRDIVWGWRTSIRSRIRAEYSRWSAIR